MKQEILFLPGIGISRYNTRFQSYNKVSDILFTIFIKIIIFNIYHINIVIYLLSAILKGPHNNYSADHRSE